MNKITKILIAVSAVAIITLLGLLGFWIDKQYTNNIIGSRTDVPRWRDIQGNINEKLIAGTGVSIDAGTGENIKKFIITASSTPDLSAYLTTTTASITYVPYSIVNTKGDILVSTSDNNITNLGVGSDGQVLTASSTSATGLSWSTSEGMTYIGSETATTSNFTIPSGTKYIYINGYIYRTIGNKVNQEVFLSTTGKTEASFIGNIDGIASSCGLNFVASGTQIIMTEIDPASSCADTARSATAYYYK